MSCLIMSTSLRILALETANSLCSVALCAGDQVLHFELHQDMRAQTQQILPMIERAMQQTQTGWQDLDVIGFSRGPGAFSGVRINAAVAQALAWAHDLPVVPVSSLQALAQQAARQGRSGVTAVIDARMDEVYLGRFAIDDEGIMQPLIPETLLDYDSARRFGDMPVVGSGAVLMGHHADDTAADARDIAVLTAHYAAKGQTVRAADALPVYLRESAWKKIAEQRSPTS